MTRTVWEIFSWLDVHHEPLLGCLVISYVLHLVFSVLLFIGAIKHRRLLLLPWLCSDMVILVIMVATFTFTCFLSFFVDLLVAIVFPVVAGLVLGLWIFLWRGVQAHYTVLGRKVVAGGYRPVPRLQARPLPPITEDHS